MHERHFIPAKTFSLGIIFLTLFNMIGGLLGYTIYYVYQLIVGEPSYPLQETDYSSLGVLLKCALIVVAGGFTAGLAGLVFEFLRVILPSKKFLGRHIIVSSSMTTFLFTTFYIIECYEGMKTPISNDPLNFFLFIAAFCLPLTYYADDLFETMEYADEFCAALKEREELED